MTKQQIKDVKKVVQGVRVTYAPLKRAVTTHEARLLMMFQRIENMLVSPYYPFADKEVCLPLYFREVREIMDMIQARSASTQKDKVVMRMQDPDTRPEEETTEDNFSALGEDWALEHMIEEEEEDYEPKI